MKTGSRESKDEQFLLKLEQLVRQHLEDEDFGVQELAAEAGYSRSQLYRRLKLLVGVSTSVFIRKIRLHEALEMLRHDEATTSEIAYRVGFHSPSYFHRCFHKFYGITPGTFKEECKTRKNYAPGENTNSFSEDIHSRFPPHSRKKNIRRSVWLLVFIFVSVVILLANYYKETTSPFGQKTPIAVLPFAYFSAQEETRFFADGMADNLILRLSMLDEFQVVSRTTSENYRDRGGRSISEIAEALEVEYLIEGSVQCLGDHARIHIKLIHARSDTPVWSRMYDRRLQDQFTVQSEISNHIVTMVHELLTDTEITAK